MLHSAPSVLAAALGCSWWAATSARALTGYCPENEVGFIYICALAPNSGDYWSSALSVLYIIVRLME
jgi:hypothetical protein